MPTINLGGTLVDDNRKLSQQFSGGSLIMKCVFHHNMSLFCSCRTPSALDRISYLSSIFDFIRVIWISQVGRRNCRRGAFGPIGWLRPLYRISRIRLAKLISTHYYQLYRFQCVYHVCYPFCCFIETELHRLRHRLTGSRSKLRMRDGLHWKVLRQSKVKPVICSRTLSPPPRFLRGVGRFWLQVG